MRDLLTVWIHLIAAIFWIGGMLFFSVILVPCLRKCLAASDRAILIRQVGKRFRVFGWISLAVLFVTGLMRLLQNGVLIEAYGNILKVKFGLICLMVVLAVLHDFIFGPKARQYAVDGGGDNPYLKAGRWVARFNLVVGLLIVLSAVSLVRAY